MTLFVSHVFAFSGSEVFLCVRRECWDASDGSWQREALKPWMSTATTAQRPGHPAAALAYVSLDDLLGGDFPGRRIPGDGRLVAADHLTVREASLFFIRLACGFVIWPDLPLVLHLRGRVLYFHIHVDHWSDAVDVEYRARTSGVGARYEYNVHLLGRHTTSI